MRIGALLTLIYNFTKQQGPQTRTGSILHIVKFYSLTKQQGSQTSKEAQKRALPCGCSCKTNAKQHYSIMFQKYFQLIHTNLP